MSSRLQSAGIIVDERKPIVRRPLETITLEGVSGTSFGSKLSFTVGTSFLFCRRR